MTLHAWRALLTRLRRPRCESLGVLLHEIEETLPADATPGSGRCRVLARARRHGVSDAAGELETPDRLDGVARAERATRLPALVPSLADCVRLASAALSGSSPGMPSDDARAEPSSARDGAAEEVDRARRAAGGARRRLSSKKPSSGFCSTPSGSSSRSATTSPTGGSTARTTTCSPRKRVWRASWPSPRHRFRTSTGSSWVAR